MAQLTIKAFASFFRQADGASQSKSTIPTRHRLGGPKHSSSVAEWVAFYNEVGLDQTNAHYQNEYNLLVARYEKLVVLVDSLKAWHDYNQDIVRFCQVDWRGSVAPSNQNVQVAHSPRNIGSSSMREVLFGLESASFHRGQSSDFVSAAEEYKNSITRNARRHLKEIIDTCSSNKEKAQSALGEARNARHLEYKAVDELNATWNIAKTRFEGAC